MIRVESIFVLGFENDRDYAETMKQHILDNACISFSEHLRFRKPARFTIVREIIEAALSLFDIDLSHVNGSFDDIFYVILTIFP